MTDTATQDHFLHNLLAASFKPRSLSVLQASHSLDAKAMSRLEKWGIGHIASAREFLSIKTVLCSVREVRCNTLRNDEYQVNQVQVFVHVTITPQPLGVLGEDAYLLYVSLIRKGSPRIYEPVLPYKWFVDLAERYYKGTLLGAVLSVPLDRSGVFFTAADRLPSDLCVAIVTLRFPVEDRDISDLMEVYPQFIPKDVGL